MATNTSGLGSSQIVDANPTKDFFITMLTRDISLVRSIVDLVDNSVDAANTCDDVASRWVKITISDSKFIIEDNCGGIDEGIAKTQAFRFGRPESAAHALHSVGRFGVGMKRTLFKLGRHFVVTSRHSGSSFEVDVDVDSWLEEDEWEFKLNNIDEIDGSLGTVVEVDSLLPSVADQFKLDSFINTLREEVGAAHFKALNNGLSITINNEVVEAANITIKQSEELGVIGVEKNIAGVDVTIRAGIGPRGLHEGGWYIICNGRLIEAADQSKLSGWDSDGIPRYHPDYAYFRGVVDFECDDSDKLPWTTTKTGVDSDNGVYRSAKTEIQSIMRRVLPFLKDRAKEAADFNKESIEATPLDDAIESAAEVNIFEASYSSAFTRPERLSPNRLPVEITVSYKVSIDQLNIVKDALGASSASEAGRETFNYFYDMECEA